MNLKVCAIFIFAAVIIFFTVDLLERKWTDSDSVNQTFIISSGSQGGAYYKAGKLIEEILNKRAPNQYSFKLVSSNGSIDNISRLKNRFADFAIVQKNILIKNFYGNGNKIKNISVIAPLFEEKFLIYTHLKKDITFEKFNNIAANSNSKLKIGVTNKNGAAFQTFKRVAELLDISLDDFDFVEKNYSGLVKDFNSNEIDFLLTLSLPLLEVEKLGAKVLYFSDSNIILLNNRMSYFSIVPVAQDSNYKTLGVLALFVGLNSGIEKLNETNFLSAIENIGREENYISLLIETTVDRFQSGQHAFNKDYGILPVISPFTVQTDNYFMVFLIIFVSILVLIFYRNQYLLSKRIRLLKYFWIRYSHVLFGLIAISISYFLCVEYLIVVEEEFYKLTTIKSPILDLTKVDLHLWNVVRIFAGNDDGVFPFSLYGKLVTTLSTYVVFLGAIAITIAEVIIYKLIEKRRGGLMVIKHKNHIIISGWSSDAPKLIKELNIASSEYHRKSYKIVCVVADPEKILETESEINQLEKEKKIIFVKGDLRNKEIVKKSNAFFASSIILLAEDASINADEKTLLRALSISKYNKLKGVDSRHNDSSNSEQALNNTYVIAEVNNEDFIDDLKNTGVNGIVNRGRIIKGILVQSLLNPGVSKLLNNVLTFSEETNEFYTIDLKDNNNAHLRYKKFDELLLPLRKQQILLLAIKVVYLDAEGRDIVDEDELNSLLHNDGLTRQIITNPINSNETSREADEDDQLIVLTASMDSLQAGVKNISF